jgi:DNA-binding MarR family transcriptional regulator
MVVDAIRRVVRGLRLAEQATRAAGLSAAQTFVLAHVAESPASSLSELAERTMTDRSSVAGVVERLIEAGLVITDRDESDRRRVTVRITPAGRATLRSAPPAPTAQIIAALERMPAESRRALARRLDELTRAMGLGEGPAPMLFEDSPAAARTARRVTVTRRGRR